MGRGPATTGRWQRTAAAAIAALVGTGWGVLGGGVVAATAAEDGWAFAEATNGSRQRPAGLDVLARVADLDAVAARHAAAMADRGGLFHNANLATEVEGWSVVTENVGVGTDVASIHQSFLDSSAHRANMLDARVSQFGVGVATTRDGRMWVVEVFRKPVATSPAPTVTPVRRLTAVSTEPAAGAAAAAARRAESEARATAEARARAEAEAAARVAAEIAAVAASVALSTQAPYVLAAAPVVLPAPAQASSSGSAPPARPAVAVVAAGGLWLLVAVSLLRRLQSGVLPATHVARRLELQKA